MATSRILLSAFADEASQSKRAEEQLAVMAALGLRRYTLRFIDLGGGVKNAMELTADEVKRLVELNAQFGLRVATLGSPIGKVKLHDVDDGTANSFVPFEQYLEQDVARACDLAEALGTRLLRGFSFYHPKGESPDGYVGEVVDRLGRIAAHCAERGLMFGLEVEANLVGQTGGLLAEIHRQVNSPALCLIYDVGNIVTQGYTPEETFEQYLEMKPGLGWIHIKDYRPLDSKTKGGHIDEEALCDYRPAGRGSGVYQRVLADLAGDQEVVSRLGEISGGGVLLDLEPHVRGGGQFGGFSGPDGMGVALRSLCGLIGVAGLEHDLRGDDDFS